MIYLCYRTGSRNWVKYSVEEFETEKEALTWLESKPRTGIVGVFEGKRLNLVVGEKKVTRKVVAGFEEYQPEKVEA